jgi:SAM-dependent methyltransferase
MTALLRPFLFAKALYLDRKQRKRIEQLKAETLSKVEEVLDENIPTHLELGHRHAQAQDWLTLDLNLACDFFWDYRDGIPFPAESIDRLFSHRTLQQLSGQQVDFVFRECFRTLKPGGAFFFSVPDAEPFLRAYAEGRSFANAHHEAVWKPGWHDTGSCIDQVTYVAYGNGNAQFMFDQENVIHLCEKAGFNPTEWRSPDPEMDGAAPAANTLYVVARKPA